MGRTSCERIPRRWWLLLPGLVLFAAGLGFALAQLWLGVRWWPWGAGIYSVGWALLYTWMHLTARDRRRASEAWQRSLTEVRHQLFGESR